MDYKQDPRSSIVDGLSTMVMGGKLAKVLSWYDNEWAYSNRIIDLAKYMVKRAFSCLFWSSFIVMILWTGPFNMFSC